MMRQSFVIKSGRAVASDQVVCIPDAPASIEEQKEVVGTEAQLDVQAPEIDPEVERERLHQAMVQEATLKATEAANKILQNARLEQDKIIAQAREDSQRIRTEAQKAAYEETLNQKSGEITACLEKVDRLMNEMQQQQQSFLKQYEEGLFSLAMSIAEKVLNRAIPEHEELMVPLVKEAVSAVKNASWISVEVSSQLPGLIEALKQELANWQAVQQVEISGTNLPVGGCVVNTSYGVVDASVSVQLENLQEQFDKLEKQ